MSRSPRSGARAVRRPNGRGGRGRRDRRIEVVRDRTRRRRAELEGEVRRGDGEAGCRARCWATWSDVEDRDEAIPREEMLPQLVDDDRQRTAAQIAVCGSKIRTSETGTFVDCAVKAAFAVPKW